MLASCTSIGQFGAGVDITFDPRTIGMQIDDTIMQKNLSARLALADKKYFISISNQRLEMAIYFYLAKWMNLKKKLKLQKWRGKLKEQDQLKML